MPPPTMTTRACVGRLLAGADIRLLPQALHLRGPGNGPRTPPVGGRAPSRGFRIPPVGGRSVARPGAAPGCGHTVCRLGDVVQGEVEDVEVAEAAVGRQP